MCLRRLVLVVLAFAALSCDGQINPHVACLPVAEAGLSVGVISEQTGESVCDAAVTATDGAYTEALFAHGCRYVGAFERPGSYVVRVERSGFIPKTVTGVGVVMGAGECPHVKQIRLDVQLTREG